MEHLKFLALREALRECWVKIDPEEAAIKIAKVVEARHYNDNETEWPF